MKHLGLLAGLAMALAAQTIAFSQPAQISLQGLLTDSGGSPAAGPVNLTFRLYSTPDGAGPAFAETHSSVSLTNGVYSVNLGSINTALRAVDFAKDLWLGIQVGSDAELKPRTLLTGAATAMTLTLPAKMTGTATNTGTSALVVHNQASTGQNYALQALSEAPQGRAMYGFASHTSGANFGVYGLTNSTAGIGVRGRASTSSGTTIGVEGTADSNSGAGVKGTAAATSGSTIGVSGTATASPSGVGLKGEGGAYGVDGSSTATGGRFQGATGVRAIGSTLGGLITGLDGLKVSASDDSRSDLILGGLNSLYAAGRISSDPNIAASNIVIESNTGIDVRLNHDGISPTGSFTIFNSLGTRLFEVTIGGDVKVGGAVVNESDRALKEEIEAIDTRGILEDVALLPISQWRYKSSEGTHIGPMAQDFYAAFGLGSTDRGIASVDADGVALAAIQGLYALVMEQQERLSAQEREIEALKTALTSNR